MRFADIIGQEALKERLVRSVQENRVSHAQLFLGPEGSGHLPLAVAYAQYLLCTDRGEQDACGVCSSCQRVAKLEHPDLHFSFPIVKEKKVEKSDDVITAFRQAFLKQPYMNLRYWYSVLEAESKSGLIPDAEAGSIIHKLNYKAYEGQYKVLIMWMADLMNATTSNHLLKIIEEPPDQTVFILIAQQQEQLLPTILSRTQLIKIPRLEDEQIREALIRLHGVDSEDAGNQATLAEGNYWAALSSVLQLEDSGYNMQTFRQWMLLCNRKDVAGLIDWVDEFAALNREQQRNFLRYGLHIFRQCIVGTYTDNELLRATEEEQEFISRFSAFVHGYNVVPLMEEFNKAHYYVERNANPKLVFLTLSFRVVTLMFPKKR